MRVLDEYGTSELWKAIKSYAGGSGGVVQWEDILGRPDLSNVSSMKVSVVVLRSDLWSDNQQTVAIDGISADETQQLIIPVPQKVNEDSYSNAGVICMEQGENSLVFRADNTPDEDLYVNVFVFGAAEVKEESGTFEWWSPKMTSNSIPTPYIASASSIYSDSYPAYLAFDDDKNNFWASDMGRTVPQWIMFDFGMKTTVNGIRIFPRRNSLDQTPISGTIEASNDKSDWAQLSQFNIEPVVSADPIDFMFSPVKYRYYRIYNMKSISVASLDSVSLGDINFSLLGGKP